MGQFTAFSLTDGIKARQAGQQVRLNRMRMNAYQADEERKQTVFDQSQDRDRNLQQIAQESMRTTYNKEDYDLAGPNKPTGEKYDPEMNEAGMREAGYTKEANALERHLSQMAPEERKQIEFDAKQGGVDAFNADTEEKWEILQNKLEIEAEIAGKDFNPRTWGERQDVINEARDIGDVLNGGKDAKAPKTRNIRKGTELVNQEWDAKTKSWKEVGRGPVSQQQINLRNKPSEVAAGKDYEDILEDSRIAEDQIFTIQKAKALMPEIETGKLEPLKNWAREWGTAIGVSIDADKMADSVSFRAVMKGAVLDGMKSIKGTASEADRKTVEDAVASFDKPEQANKFLLNTAESLSRRKVEQANFYDDFSVEHDGSLLGARKAWSSRMSDIPLIKKVKGKYFHYYKFKELMQKSNKAAFANATTEEIDSYIDEYWKR